MDSDSNQPQLSCFVCCEIFIRKIRKENRKLKLSSLLHFDDDSIVKVQKDRLARQLALSKKN